ncbi:HNH endonuclease [Fictibacillus sp. KIGAM418]|uniref:HNH endonuclease n=1 Tax=Fictibacillus marinisediminis TaxID=2878389 RepID=A0A9X1XCC5_9BACL|nr:HNH endonuclease [Fictibacillus marinisediminis]
MGVRDDCKTCRKFENSVGLANRRAEAVGESGRLTLRQVKHLFTFFHDAYCPLCGKPFDDGKHNPSLDHVTPLSRGGKNELGNVVIVGNSCNSRKGIPA